MDCDLDFFCMTAVEAEARAEHVGAGWHISEWLETRPDGTEMVFRQDEATAKQLRIDAMVKAVSSDLKHELKHCSNRFCPGAVVA